MPGVVITFFTHAQPSTHATQHHSAIKLQPTYSYSTIEDTIRTRIIQHIKKNNLVIETVSVVWAGVVPVSSERTGESGYGCEGGSGREYKGCETMLKGMEEMEFQAVLDTMMARGWRDWFRVEYRVEN